jgi:hypothetical protein
MSVFQVDVNAIGDASTQIRHLERVLEEMAWEIKNGFGSDPQINTNLGFDCVEGVKDLADDMDQLLVDLLIAVGGQDFISVPDNVLDLLNEQGYEVTPHPDGNGWIVVGPPPGPDDEEEPPHDNQGKGKDKDKNHGHGPEHKPPNHPHGEEPPAETPPTDETPPLPNTGGSDSSGESGGSTGSGAGVPLVTLTGGATGSGSSDDEEEETEAPEYYSSTNSQLAATLKDKQDELEETSTNLESMREDRENKMDVLEQLQAAVVVNSSPELEQRIADLKRQITDLDLQIYNDTQLVAELEKEVDLMSRRLDFVVVGPGADLEAIQKLEGGETSQWIKDNTWDCVNYIVNRMPIPPELPLNAHSWDEQALKIADKYGIKIGDVPLEGSVIVMEREHSYASEVYGHVMYVEKVENGIVWVTDNNYPDKLVRLDHLTEELTGPHIKYLYFPWQTRA